MEDNQTCLVWGKRVQILARAYLGVDTHTTSNDPELPQNQKGIDMYSQPPYSRKLNNSIQAHNSEAWPRHPPHGLYPKSGLRSWVSPSQDPELLGSLLNQPRHVATITLSVNHLPLGEKSWEQGLLSSTNPLFKVRKLQSKGATWNSYWYIIGVALSKYTGQEQSFKFLFR